MFAKFKQSAKEAYQQGKDKVKEVKREYKDKKQNGWLAEVQTENSNFKPVKNWFLQYEPSNAPKEESKSSNAIQQKMNQVLVDTMTRNIVRTIMESLALATEAAAQEIEKYEPQIFQILNGITAIFLTYRFQYKKKSKFQYLRGVAIDRIALSFVEFMDQEARKLGKDPSQIDEELIQKIVDKVVDLIANSVEKKKDLTIKKFKESPLFNMSLLNNHDDIDEIIKMVLEIIQTYGETKINECIGKLRSELPAIFRIIAVNAVSIRQNIEYANKYHENSPEYTNGTQQKIYSQIDGIYYKLKDFIRTFIGRFSGLIIQNSAKEQGEEEKEKE